MSDAPIIRETTPSDNGQAQQPTAAVPDPFDPAALRLSQDFTQSVGVKKEILKVPVRKPHKTWFVRSHPDESFRIQVAAIEMGDMDRETYMIAPELRGELSIEPAFSLLHLQTAITRQGAVFLWSIKLPGPDGRLTDWTRTALAAAEEARDKWVQVVSDHQVGGYEVRIARVDIGEPEWPDKTFAEILRLAFRNNYIADVNHPVLQQLRGEV